MLMALLLNACNGEAKFRPDERYTLLSDSDSLFGGSTARRMFEYFYQEDGLETNALSFDAWFDRFDDEETGTAGHLYIIMAPGLSLYNSDVEAMRNFVSGGNTLMLITDGLPEAFSKEFMLDVASTSSPVIPYSTGTLRLTDTIAFTKRAYSYFYQPMLMRVTQNRLLDRVDTLGVNETGQPGFVRLGVGSGSLLLHTNARAFSNYFLLQPGNTAYLAAVAAYLPRYTTTTIWDDFYAKHLYRRPENASVFSALMEVPALKWALLIALAVAAVYVLSHLRRMQRIIPAKEPNVNTTLAFVQTIAGLYFNSRDNNNIARKMERQFQQHVQRNYFIPSGLSQAERSAAIASRTNMKPEESYEMLFLFHQAQTATQVSDEELLKLHSLMHRAMHPAHQAAVLIK